MPRFHFNVGDGRFSQDNDGTELPDAETACLEATRLLGAMLADDPTQLSTGHELNVDVTDSSGLLLHRVYASAVASAAAKSRLYHRS